MRILFNSIEFPKKSAKRLHKSFKDVADFTKDHFTCNIPLPVDDYKEIKEISLSKAQAYTAEMLGYRDWHELEEVTKSNSSMENAFDEDVTFEEETERTYHQWDVLNNYFHNGHVNKLVFGARVSAKSPTSIKLQNDVWFNNELYIYEEGGQWELRHSIRSDLNSEMLNNIYEQWTYDKSTGSSALKKATLVLDKEPENITAMWLCLCVLVNDSSLLKKNNARLNEFELQMEKLFTEDFKNSKDKRMTWNRLGNRDLLRILVMLGDAFHQLGDYKRADYWFSTTQSMTKMFDEGYKSQIKEVKRRVEKL